MKTIPAMEIVEKQAEILTNKINKLVKNSTLIVKNKDSSRKKWIRNGIRNSIKIRDKMYKRAVKTKDLELMEKI